MRVSIQNADAVLFAGEAEEILLPTISGGIGVRNGHASLITSLRAGEITVINKDVQKKVLCHAGTAEVTTETVMVFIESPA